MAPSGSPSTRRGAMHAGVHARKQPEIIAPELLMLAYRGGIFPMADHRDDPDIFWVEPRKRAILPLDGLKVSRSLARALRRERFRVTCNAAFGQVLGECAAPRPGEDKGEDEGGESWISRRIAASYMRLHELGHAHSIECWRDDRLVGGLYGVGFDRVFCGESMFSRMPDASKVALCWLVAAMRAGGFALLDCQFMTPHLESLGAIEITQAHYVRLLKAAQRSAPSPEAGEDAGDGDGDGDGEAVALPAAFAALPGEAEGVSSSPGNFIAQSLTQTS